MNKKNFHLFIRYYGNYDQKVLVTAKPTIGLENDFNYRAITVIISNRKKAFFKDNLIFEKP